jgi:hypothetical protein
LGEVAGGELRLRAAFEDSDGAYHRAEASGPVAGAAAVVDAVADRIRDA